MKKETSTTVYLIWMTCAGLFVGIVGLLLFLAYAALNHSSDSCGKISMRQSKCIESSRTH